MNKNNYDFSKTYHRLGIQHQHQHQPTTDTEKP